MAPDVKGGGVGYNSAILPEILRTRSMTSSQLARALDYTEDELEEALSREPQPSSKVLSDIAKKLAISEIVFFMAEAPRIPENLPDFRSANPTASSKDAQTIKAIQMVQEIQAMLRNDLALPLDLPRFSPTNRKQIEDFAFQAREYFGITLEDQLDARDGHAFYVLCRRKIETRGIFVLQNSFPETDGSGFCLSDPVNPVIVVNSKKQTSERRLFTLMHELAHVLMGQSGISDPFKSQNTIERQCNQFASAFLAPRSYLATLLPNDLPLHPSTEDVRFAARRLRLSQQATVLRLEEVGRYAGGSHDNWISLVHNSGNPDYESRRGGGGDPPDQEKVKLAKYGFRFADVFSERLNQNLTDALRIYRATGLKPKYQRGYFDFVRSLNSDELVQLELGDA